MTLLARTRALGGGEWRVLLEAAALTPVAALAVRGLPLPKAIGLVRAFSLADPSTPPPGTRVPSLALDRLSTLVEWTASRLGARCLVQAIVLQAILRRRGMRADVVVGAAADPSQPVAGNRSARPLAAHAWVEYEGAVLIGAAEIPYVPLCRLTCDPLVDEAPS
jgi:hypothetical protein